MHVRRSFLLTLALTLGLLFSANAQVVVDPMGFGLAIENGDEVATEITLRSLGESEVAFDVSFDLIEPDDRENPGPRRDQPEGIFALFQDRAAWGGNLWQQVLDQVDGLEYERFQSGAFDDFEIDDFDILWVVHSEQVDAFNRAYNDNRERIEEWVDAGGVMYASTGTNQYNVVPIHPGGLTYTRGGASNGRVLVSGDPDEDNYNHLAELMEWEPNTLLRGSSLFHVHYEQDDIDDIENSDWSQNIARLDGGGNHPGILVYNYGRGHCVVGGVTDGHQQRNYGQPPNWGSAGEELCHYLDFLTVPAWFMADPDEGVVAGGEETTFELILTPEGIDEGLYEIILLIELNDEDQPLIQMSAFISVDSAVGDVLGTVTEASSGDAIEDVELSIDDHHYVRLTDENGEYSMENAPVGIPFDVTVTKEDYLTHRQTVELEEPGEVVWDIELLQATCIIEPDEIDYAIEPDFLVEGIEFTVTNDGDGPLDWSVTRHLLGGADADPWELREEIAAGEILEDSYLSGVVFIDGLYYISGGNNRQDENFIYILNEDGEEVDRFPQFAESRYGMRDLAFDGELIWGSDDGVVYGFTPEGDLEVSYEVEVNPARAVAWDSDNDILWVCTERTDIFGYDREGNNVAVIEKEGDISITSLGYYPDDADGYFLYIFTRDTDDVEGASNTRVYKLNPEDGEIMFVADLQLEGARAGGLYMTNLFDIYSWVFVGLLENAGLTPDALAVWQVDVRIGWMQVEPTEGILEADDSQLFNMTLDATGLPVALFEGELIFEHDGEGGETHLPVTMNVTDEPVQTFRNLSLNFGWNLVSLNIEPNEEEVPVLMAPLVEAGDLVMVKNGAGQFFVPSEDFNNIPGWAFEEGYMVKMNRDARLEVRGLSVVADAEIVLLEGWNLSSYYPRRRVEATLALSALVETGHLVIAKDGFGHFYVPEYGFSNIGLMREGQGYQFSVDEDVNLVYVQELVDEGAPERDETIHRQIASAPKNLPELPVTGQNMSLLIMADESVFGEIGVYSGDLLVGSGVLEDGRSGVAVWGDDPTTDAIDGAVDGASLSVRLVRGSGSQSVLFTTMTGSATYHTDSFWAIELGETEEAIPESFGLESVYPNPFNSQTLIRYALVESSPINLSLYDLSGRLVSELVSGVQSAGYHTASVNGIDMPSGVYIVRLQSDAQVAQQKLTLIK